MIVEVYSSEFSVPGEVVQIATNTIRISYTPPGDEQPRTDWFHAIGTNLDARRGGRRMGDPHEEQATRYRETE